MSFFIDDKSGDVHISRIITSTVLGLAFSLGFTCNATNNWTYSEGDRVGMVNKISKKGAFWQTYEGQMALEGISGSGASLGANVWDFAIDNYWSQDKKEDFAKKLEEAMKSGQKVKIHYIEMLKTLPWRSESDHLIQSIEPVNVGGLEEKVKDAAPSGTETKPNTTEYKEITIDGIHYTLKHDSSGKLRVIELKEVQ